MYNTILAVLVIAMVSAEQVYVTDKAGDEPSWNYDKNGVDWTDKDCNVTTASRGLSPINITNINDTVTKNVTYFDWLNYKFSIIPRFRPVKLTFNGPENWVHKVRVEDDTSDNGFHGFWGAEPFN